MFFGRAQLGKWLYIGVQCVDANRTPSLPVDAPILKIKRASDGVTVYSREIPLIDKQGVSIGFFMAQVFLGIAFNPGSYATEITYTVGTNSVILTGAFRVIDGGHPNGQVIGMAWFDRPNRSNIVYQVEAGRIMKGANPRVA